MHAFGNSESSPRALKNHLGKRSSKGERNRPFYVTFNEGLTIGDTREGEQERERALFTRLYRSIRSRKYFSLQLDPGETTSGLPIPAIFAYFLLKTGICDAPSFSEGRFRKSSDSFLKPRASPF